MLPNNAQRALIIDAHAHIFPDKIARSASDGIQRFYDLPVAYDGRVDTLFEAGGAAGVSHFVVQSVATVPEQARSINQFIAGQTQKYPERITGLGTMHPDSVRVDEEFDEILRLGLRGIKLHPDFQKFNIDDPKVFPIYERAEGVLPVLIHVGDHRTDYSHPRRLLNALKAFPRLTVIAAHLGGWSEWPAAAEYLAETGVYADTSSSLYAMTPEAAVRMIRLFGPERVLFGTDYPMWDYGEEMKRFEKLELSDTDKRRILFENARELFSIDLFEN